ncbi:MAG: radical SAM protein [Clostridiales bacterium]|nr:radical SAM protein [Clostridiales bacterium]
MEEVYLLPIHSYFIVCSQADILTYFEVRRELEQHFLNERLDFYHFGQLGFSFLRQDEKGILKAPIADGRKRYLMVEGKKITFSQILIIPNITCSLRCKHCAAGNQFAERKVFDCKQTVDDFDKLLSACKTKQVNIQGGEVFLNPEISRFFELLAQMENIKSCESVAVFTNATVIPADEQLIAYNKIDLPKIFMISNYNRPNVKVAEFVAKIKSFNLDYCCFPPDEFWFHPSSPDKEIGYTEEELKEVINRCTKFTRAPKLIDGKFFACGQNGYALYNKLRDFVDIRNCPLPDVEEQIYNHIFNMSNYDICKYCRGEYANCERIPVAEQL